MWLLPPNSLLSFSRYLVLPVAWLSYVKWPHLEQSLTLSRWQSLSVLMTPRAMPAGTVDLAGLRCKRRQRGQVVRVLDFESKVLASMLEEKTNDGHLMLSFQRHAEQTGITESTGALLHALPTVLTTTND